ncbi:FAD-linked oxidoreductase ZEB1 [Apiospora arundinis]
MYETPIPRPSPVEGLSVELVRLVLSALPDVASLQATVLSCPLFYKVFLGAKVVIIAQVLFHQMDPSILHDAIAAYESSRLRLNGIYNEESSSKDKDGLRSFIDQNIRLRPDMPPFWSLQQVLRVTRLHGLVCEIATKFVNDVAAGSPLNQTGFISVTHQERCRIERALYRFEIYCNLFRTLLGMPRGSIVERAVLRQDPEELKIFFTSFPPWEAEQLACIPDFLFKAVLPDQSLSHNHDVAWGALNVEYGGVGVPTIEHILSWGLEKVHQIFQAKTYDERHELLGHLYLPGGGVNRRPGLWAEPLLYSGLGRANDRTNIIVLKWLTPEDGNLLRIKEPHRPDSDSDSDTGPFDVSETTLQEQRDAARRQTGLRTLWVRRERIWSDDGRGWWSWSDESKVRYPRIMSMTMSIRWTERRRHRRQGSEPGDPYAP